MTSNTPLKKTPLYSLHKQLGAKMAEFGGWEMPIEYSGIVQEHMAVRLAAGFFDISHMGQILIEGPESLDLLQHVTCNDVSRLKDQQIHYSALLYPEGTFVDDILVHRLAPNSYLLCVNASNTHKDFTWILHHNRYDAAVSDVSRNYAQLALQGPKAASVLQTLVDIDLGKIKYYWLGLGRIQNVDCLFTRTGYTGEDGFEIYCDPAVAGTTLGFDSQKWATRRTHPCWTRRSKYITSGSQNGSIRPRNLRQNHRLGSRFRMDRQTR